MNSPQQWKKIIVPTDFSSCAETAVRAAIAAEAAALGWLHSALDAVVTEEKRPLDVTMRAQVCVPAFHQKEVRP